MQSGPEIQAVRDKAEEVLAATTSVDLSTSAGNVPYGSGAFFAELDLFTLTCVLETSGRTLANLRANPTVSCKIVSAAGDPFKPFLQGMGEVTVREREAGESQNLVSTLLAKEPRVAGFLDFPVEVVTISITEWFVTDVSAGLFKKALAPTTTAS